jgi:hypothetical protein
LIEELDKVNEINPSNGDKIERPVMNFIKDLLNDGRASYMNRDAHSSYGRKVDVDIRDAYTIVTMNFAIDRFHFKADPRLTTIGDMMKVWSRLKGRPADLKEVLGSMFLPETVSRLIPRFNIMKPLEQDDYKKLVRIQTEDILKNRIFDQAGRNRLKTDFKMTEAYFDYLYREAVIPSEGGRYTAVIVRNRFSTDLENALAKLPRTSKKRPIQPYLIELDFNSQTTAVVAKLIKEPGKQGAQSDVISERVVTLTFPPHEMTGRIPRKRLHTAIHEFGHAFTGVNFGKRFEYATVIPPENGTGGYVKFLSGSQTAKSLLASIFASLGSRAMERIFLSDSPLDARSVLDISSGASSDIQAATQDLWSLIYKFGFDPAGGVLDRVGKPYANFSDLTSKQVEDLGIVLRKMEDYLIEHLLSVQSKDWYVEKIEKFARNGGYVEEEFYNLIGYPHPGKSAFEFGDPSKIDETFPDSVELIQSDLEGAMQFKQGRIGRSAAQNLEAATLFFQELLEKCLHSDGG